MFNKTKSTILGLSLLLTFSMAMATDFTLKIDGKHFKVSTDNSSNINVGDKSYRVQLIKNSIQDFKSKYVSFNYIKEVQPSRQNLSADMSQTVMATPLGSVLLVQEYNMKFTGNELYPMMKSEFTKQNPPGVVDSKNKKITKRLSNGETISGISYESYNKETGKVTLTYKLYVHNVGQKTALIVEVNQNAEELKDDLVDKSFKVFWDSYKFSN